MNNTKVVLVELKNKMVAMNFFNSKEVYSQKYFDSMKKAQNYCKKYNYAIISKLPENIDYLSIYNN